MKFSEEWPKFTEEVIIDFPVSQCILQACLSYSAAMQYRVFVILLQVSHWSTCVSSLQGFQHHFMWFISSGLLCTQKFVTLWCLVKCLLQFSLKGLEAVVTCIAQASHVSLWQYPPCSYFLRDGVVFLHSPTLMSKGMICADSDNDSVLRRNLKWEFSCETMSLGWVVLYNSSNGVQEDLLFTQVRASLGMSSLHQCMINRGSSHHMHNQPLNLCTEKELDNSKQKCLPLRRQTAGITNNPCKNRDHPCWSGESDWHLWLWFLAQPSSQWTWLQCGSHHTLSDSWRCGV